MKCRNGHDWSVETTYINKTSGKRICKPCRRAAQKRYRQMIMKLDDESRADSFQRFKTAFPGHRYF